MSGVTRISKPWFAKSVLRLQPYDYVRTAVGLVLLAAAGLKIHQLLFDRPSLAIQGGLLASRWVVIAVVEVEVSIGACLLLNLWRRLIWMATLLLFSMLAIYSLTKLVNGAERCDCFGKVTFHPIVSFVFDVCVIGILSVWRPTFRYTQSVDGNDLASMGLQIERIAHPLSKTRIWMFSTFVALTGMATTVRTPERFYGNDGLAIDDDRVAIVQPDKWLGRMFPLFDYIDGASDLAFGERLLLFYRRDCQMCRDAIGQLRKTVSLDGTRCHVVLVEVPPLSLSRQPDGFCHLQLTPMIEWTIPTPLWVTLRSGIVERVQ